MTLSQDPFDKRLVQLYKIRRAETRKNTDAVTAEESAEQSSSSKPPDSFAQEVSSFSQISKSHQDSHINPFADSEEKSDEADAKSHADKESKKCSLPEIGPSRI